MPAACRKAACPRGSGTCWGRHQSVWFRSRACPGRLGDAVGPSAGWGAPAGRPHTLSLAQCPTGQWVGLEDRPRVPLCPQGSAPLLESGQCPPWTDWRLRHRAWVSGPPGQNVTMDEGNTPLLPDCLVYQIFLSLGPVDVLAAGLVCRQWRCVSRDEFLWREQFYRYYRVARDVPRHPGQPRPTALPPLGRPGGGPARPPPPGPHPEGAQPGHARAHRAWQEAKGGQGHTGVGGAGSTPHLGQSGGQCLQGSAGPHTAGPRQ